jgi:hypothetical protein
VFTSVVIDPAGKMSGTTRETAKGAIATDLKYWSAGDLDKLRAEAQLGHFGTPGTGKWTSPGREDLAPEVTIGGEFALLDRPGRGRGLGAALRLAISRAPRLFSSGYARQAEAEAFPLSCRPADRKPRSRGAWQAFGTARIREAAAKQERGLQQSNELVGLMSNIRRDYRSVVVFDKPL